MKLRITFAIAVTLLATLGACMGLVQVLDDNDAGTTDGSTPPLEASTPSDAGSSSGREASVPDGANGSVFLTVSRGWLVPAGVPLRRFTGSFVARFYDPGPLPEPAGCRSEVVAGCEVRSCPDHPGLSAGPITFQIEASEPVTVEYESFRYTHPLGREIPAGTSVRFTAPGDVVPGFDETVTMPAFPEVTLAPGTTLGFDIDAGMRRASRNRNVGVRLSGPYTGAAGLSLHSKGSTPSVEVSCGFVLDGATRLAIPAVAVSRLAPGPYQLETSFYNMVQREISDYKILFRVEGKDLTEEDLLLE